MQTWRARALRKVHITPENHEMLVRDKNTDGSRILFLPQCKIKREGSITPTHFPNRNCVIRYKLLWRLTSKQWLKDSYTRTLCLSITSWCLHAESHKTIAEHAQKKGPTIRIKEGSCNVSQLYPDALFSPRRLGQPHTISVNMKQQWKRRSLRVP